MDLQDYKELSTSEKIILVEEIWDSIAEDTIELSQDHKDVLDQRLKTAITTTERLTWEEVKRNIRAGNR